METKQMSFVAIEFFKTVNNLSPLSMEDIFTSKINAKGCPHNITVKHHNQSTYGDECLLGSKIHTKRLKQNTEKLYKI